MQGDSDKNRRKIANFLWTPKRESAALLVFADELSDEKIAENLGIHRSTLSEWKLRPEFIARVSEHHAAYRLRIRTRGIAIVENRIAAVQDRWERMRRVIEERAAAPEMQNVPGGKTGLLVHDVKSVGAGASAERVDLYEVDTGLLKELRDHERQAAQELGQWQEEALPTNSVADEIKIRPLVGGAVRKPTEVKPDAIPDAG